MFNDNNPTEAQTREVLRNLRSQGITKIELQFSGGNDEGGVDSLQALDAEGNEVSLADSNAYQSSRYNPDTKTYGPAEWQVHFTTDTGAWETRPATADEVSVALMRQVLEAPVYDRYCTFAGDFYVDGTLSWDVVAGTSEMHGSESEQVWNSF